MPIIAMSANAFDNDLKKSVECGMDGHLSKPVDVEKLSQALDEVIRNRKKRRFPSGASLGDLPVAQIAGAIKVNISLQKQLTPGS